MRLPWLSIAGLLVIVAGLAALLFFRTQSTVPTTPSTDPIADSSTNSTTTAAPQPTKLTFLTPEQGRVERPAYVGPATCAQCHQEIHKSFSSTKHPRTLREVRAEDMPDGFADGHNKFITRDGRVEFTLLRDDKRFYQIAHDKSRSHDVTRSTMDLVLGAGGVGDDVFISWHDNGLMRDTIWPTDITPHDAMGEVPPTPPLLLLRTLKSDVVTGLARAQAEELDREDPSWRVNGRRGVIQLIDRDGS